ncbi:SusD family protein [Chitinophaga costaii]|uniref:SusD family protein n=1 Tax=Chitinophaga costaii TaxID=1335309 RepID=A0A1C4C9G7_9BACT|nr:RagB/SusD family nutrient uptake outer membrane protein [Chitinophaga costaii]PUZ27179.1 RagB/SusD family nutrient uptake outer membrane protein [Chitinophaga costaii]SCC15787.1 SusD family protein [Chitinophaga costaii]
MRRLKIYSLVAAMAMISSCQKSLLYPTPTTQISDISAFDTPERIFGQVYGLYGQLKDGNFFGERYQIYNEVRGEEFINLKGNAFTALQTWNFSVNSNAQEVENLWSSAYKTINATNVFLDGMTAKGNTIVDAATADNYTGEAKFIRGLSFYSLLQLYARPYWDNPTTNPGLVIYLEGNKNPASYQKARSTVADSYKQALSDLDSAENLLPESYEDNSKGQNTTRATKGAAIAIKTRVYLSMGNYDQVIAEANKIVSPAAPFQSSAGLALVANIKDAFASINTTENIFSLPFTSADVDAPGTQNSFAEYFLPSSLGGKAEYSLNASGIVAEATWGASDARRDFVTISGGSPYLIKFSTPSPYTDWAPIIRYSEVLLNLAEALVRKNNTVNAQAVALLSAVRHRSDPSVTYTTASFASATALLDAILLERRIEFLGEGLRGPDITRQGIAFPAKGAASSTAPTSPNYIWPMSADELNQNKLAVPN